MGYFTCFTFTTLLTAFNLISYQQFNLIFYRISSGWMEDKISMMKLQKLNALKIAVIKWIFIIRQLCNANIKLAEDDLCYIEL